MGHSADYPQCVATTGLVKCGKGVVTWFTASANHMHSAFYLILLETSALYKLFTYLLTYPSVTNRYRQIFDSWVYFFLLYVSDVLVIVSCRNHLCSIQLLNVKGPRLRMTFTCTFTVTLYCVVLTTAANNHTLTKSSTVGRSPLSAPSISRLQSTVQYS